MGKILVASWKSGLGIFKADAQKVADEISGIGEAVTPGEILDKARDETTELHRCFEWDDTIAAEKYRLNQARQIVRCLVYTETEEQEEPRPPVRMFFQTNRSEGYKPTILIMQDKDEYAKLLQDAFRELKIFQQKYKTLTELDAIFAEIEVLTA